MYKFNQALVKDNDIKYWVEKYILQNINDIDNIDKLKIKNNRNDLDLINVGNSEIANYNAENNLEELNILSMHEDYDTVPLIRFSILIFTAFYVTYYSFRIILL